MFHKDQEQNIISLMKSKGLRITPQRYAVYANLLSRCDHPTVEQILTDINQDLPISSQASVYSALTVLRKCGLVREVLLEEGVTRFDANVNPHHHFICEQCGTITDLDWTIFGDLNALQSRLIGDSAPSSNIQVNSYEVTVKGICSKCR
jgi:Fe2+ or Zn2+ uptake regulation protein